MNNSEDQNEEGIESLRERTEVRMKYLQQVQKLKSQKEKYFQSRLKQYNDTIEGSEVNDMTFDYEGDYVRATLNQDKMKVNMMRTGMGVGSRKLK